jgi:hypothetical protein
MPNMIFSIGATRLGYHNTSPVVTIQIELLREDFIDVFPMQETSK